VAVTLAAVAPLSRSKDGDPDPSSASRSVHAGVRLGRVRRAAVWPTTFDAEHFTQMSSPQPVRVVTTSCGHDSNT
jgi:hypothetical protein